MKLNLTKQNMYKITYIALIAIVIMAILSTHELRQDKKQLKETQEQILAGKSRLLRTYWNQYALTDYIMRHRDMAPDGPYFQPGNGTMLWADQDTEEHQQHAIECTHYTAGNLPDFCCRQGNVTILNNAMEYEWVTIDFMEGAQCNYTREEYIYRDNFLKYASQSIATNDSHNSTNSLSDMLE